MSFKAIVFDASGTIFDDLYVVWKANSDAYEAFGFESFKTLEGFRKKFKLPIPEFHKANGIPPNLVSEVDRKFRELYPQYAFHVKIFPEVKSVLNQLEEEKIGLAIASNIPSLFLQEHLRKFEIDGYFSTITGQEDCEEQKPSPKPILITLEKLGVKPEEAMYVGDMEEDIIAGERASICTIAISREESYHPYWRLKKGNPDYLISNLGELLDIIQGTP